MAMVGVVVQDKSFQGSFRINRPALANTLSNISVTMATTLINNLVRTSACVTPSIRQTPAAILARTGRAAVDHPLAVLALIPVIN